MTTTGRDVITDKASDVFAALHHADAERADTIDLMLCASTVIRLIVVVMV